MSKDILFRVETVVGNIYYCESDKDLNESVELIRKKFSHVELVSIVKVHDNDKAIVYNMFPVHNLITGQIYYARCFVWDRVNDIKKRYKTVHDRG